MTYNQAVLTMARDGLLALSQSAIARKQPTPAQESHFLCNWMAEALKKKTYPKNIAKSLTGWIRDGRSLGANAKLKSLLERITYQYSAVEGKNDSLGIALKNWLQQLQNQEVLVITDTQIDNKLKLDNDGLPSVIISACEYDNHIQEDKLIKPISLYIRADEIMLAKSALEHRLLLSQGDKKGSLIKHHKTYRIYPDNNQAELCLLVAEVA